MLILFGGKEFGAALYELRRKAALLLRVRYEFSEIMQNKALLSLPP